MRAVLGLVLIGVVLVVAFLALIPAVVRWFGGAVIAQWDRVRKKSWTTSLQ